MEVRQRNIDSIKPYERNPRVNDQAVEAVARSITMFGFRQPIVVDEGGIIIVGHVRWKAAKKLGLTKVPVHVAKGLTSAKVRAYRIADNQTATLAAWDYNVLTAQLQRLQMDEFDIDALGFGGAQLSELLAELKTDLDDSALYGQQKTETIRCPKCGHEFPKE